MFEVPLCCGTINQKNPICVSNAKKTLLKHQSNPHIEMILIWTASIWKIKTLRLPLQNKKERPQISTAAASLVVFDVRVVPRDQSVYSSVTLKPRGRREAEGTRLPSNCGRNHQYVSGTTWEGQTTKTMMMARGYEEKLLWQVVNHHSVPCC